MVSVNADTKKAYYTVLEPTLKFDEVGQYVNNSFIVKKNNLYGLVNLKGQEIIKYKFERMYYREDTGLIEAATPDGICVVYDSNGKELCNFGNVIEKYFFTDTSQKLIVVENKQKDCTQVYNTNKKLIFDNVKGYFGTESGKYFMISYVNDTYMYIYDSKFNLIRKINNVNYTFGTCGEKYIYYSDKDANKTTIESYDGKVSVSFNGYYWNSEEFGNKVLLYNFGKMENVCCCDLSSKTVTYLPKADTIIKISDDKYLSTIFARDESGRADVVSIKRKNTVYDLKGNAIFDSIEECFGIAEVCGESKKYCIVYNGSTSKLVDSNGKVIVNNLDGQIYNFFGDYIECYKSVIKVDGTVVVNKKEFEKISSFYSEYFAGCVNGKWGFYKIGKEPAKTQPTVKKPARVTLKSAKNIKGKKVKLVWKKVKSISGYQLLYAQNKKFTKVKKSVNIKKSATTKTVKKLKKKKTYYFKIRAYKKVGNKKYYGKWSKVKKVKITK